jgi:hypothetical protein
MPRDPAVVVRALRACRDAMIAVASHVKIGGAVYQAAGAVIVAIDRLATVLTGERDYFAGQGTGATQGELDAAKLKAARERGDAPWET